jgi:hypothetical protein
MCEGQGGQRQVKQACCLQQLRVAGSSLVRRQADKVRACGVNGGQADVEELENVIGRGWRPQSNAGNEAGSRPSW